MQVAGTDIREDVRVTLGLSTFSANTKPDTSTVNRLIVRSSQELAGRIKAIEGSDDFFTKDESVTLNSSQGYVDLTTLTENFVALRKVAWMRSTSESPVPIERASIDRTFSYGIDTRDWGSIVPTYRLTNNRITFYPAPSSTVTVRLYYDSDIGLESDLSNTVTLYPGWQEWIVMDVCRRICQLVKKLGDASYYEGQRESAWQLIVGASMGRDQWNPPQVRDVRDGLVEYPTDWPGYRRSR
jgi:hypothetical protein